MKRNMLYCYAYSKESVLSNHCGRLQINYNQISNAANNFCLRKNYKS